MIPIMYCQISKIMNREMFELYDLLKESKRNIT